MLLSTVVLVYLVFISTEKVSSFFTFTKLIDLKFRLKKVTMVQHWQVPLTVVGGLASLIPMSIPIDKALQNGVSRIKKIANYRIEGSDGDVFTYFARPKTSITSKKRPVVILVHQFFGLKERDTELCDELAKSGYFAIAPDCFQGNTTSVIPRAISFVTRAAYKDDWELPLRDMHRVISFLEKNCSSW